MRRKSRELERACSEVSCGVELGVSVGKERREIRKTDDALVDDGVEGRALVDIVVQDVVDGCRIG